MSSKIVYDMPEDEYFALNRQSKSKLSLLGDDIVYEDWLIGYKGSTRAMDFGKLVHLAVLEPERWDVDVVVAPEVNRRTKAGKAEWAEFEAANAGKIVTTQADYDAARKAADRVINHPVAGPLFTGGRAEATVLWTDRPTGIECKGRIDYLNVGQGLIVDLKTTRDPKPKAFEKSVRMFKYHAQQEMYKSGLKHVGIDIDRFLFVAVGSYYPYHVAVYELDLNHAMQGQHLVRKWLDAVKRFRDAEETGQTLWSSLPTEIQTLEMPTWAAREPKV